MEQLSQEWFEARKGKVTASMAGAILGLDPNCSRSEAMRRMVRDAEGAEREFKGNIATQWGQMHEQEAREEFSYLTRLEVTPASFCVHSVHDWLGASPDGFIGDNVLLEIKCPYGLRNHDAPVPFKTVAEQPHYYAQMQVQMYVTGRDKVLFLQWTPNEHVVTIVEYDPAWIAENIPKLEAFYQEFLREDASKHIADKRIKAGSPQAAQLIAEYDDVVKSITEAEDRKKEIIASLVEIAGGVDADFSGRKLTEVKREGSISYAKAIKELAPNADLEKWRGKPTGYWTLK